MAVTKLWHIRGSMKDLIDYVENPEKTVLRDSKTQDFFNVFSYARNPDKTADEQYVTAINCQKDVALRQMILTKKQYGKDDGYIAWHGYQSFKPGEVTPEQCHAIGLELAKRLWWPHYQVLVATHLDREHLHNHFLINSVSMVNGKKFNDDKRCYYEMRRVSDAICRERGLSVIDKPKSHTPRSIFFAEKRGEPTKYNLMREAIDKALAVCSTPEDLRTELRRLGYEISSDPNRKYPTLKRIGAAKATRLYRLGEDYDIPAMLKQIERNNYLYGRRMYERFREEEERKTCRPPAKQYRLRGSYRHVKKATGLQAVYLRFCFELGILPKPPATLPGDAGGVPENGVLFPAGCSDRPGALSHAGGRGAFSDRKAKRNGRADRSTLQMLQPHPPLRGPGAAVGNSPETQRTDGADCRSPEGTENGAGDPAPP